MQINVLGTGNVGSVLARRLADLGHTVTTANTSTPAEKSARQAAEAELTILAVPFGAVAELPAELRAALADRIVVDATNPLAADYLSLTVGHTTSGGEQVAAALPGARVVKAFNTAMAVTMETGALSGTPCCSRSPGTTARPSPPSSPSAPPSASTPSTPAPSPTPATWSPPSNSSSSSPTPRGTAPTSASPSPAAEPTTGSTAGPGLPAPPTTAPAPIRAGAVSAPPADASGQAARSALPDQAARSALPDQATRSALPAGFGGELGARVGGREGDGGGAPAPVRAVGVEPAGGAGAEFTDAAGGVPALGGSVQAPGDGTGRVSAPGAVSAVRGGPRGRPRRRRRAGVRGPR
ncbi:NADPH-dependent F420 reductase [Kitasatospora saccharophila]|uniref:NADPH-dependent F420 reductase n=1 Tax=Kitasatospora saccharophila TaxID=407973 RepID=UPI00362BCB62